LECLIKIERTLRVIIAGSYFSGDRLSGIVVELTAVQIS
jgi:hypothetical protein